MRNPILSYSSNRKWGHWGPKPKGPKDQAAQSPRGTMSGHYFQTKTEISGLSCTLRSYLKVFTGIKKKNLKKIFFCLGENLKSDPKFFSDKVNFQMKPSRVVNIGSGNVGRRYVMPTYSGHIPKSKVCTYGLALSCAGLKGLKKHFGKKQKKYMAPRRLELATSGLWIRRLTILPSRHAYRSRAYMSTRISPINGGFLVIYLVKLL